MSDDPYVYPGTSVPRNERGIRDAETLDYAERLYTVRRAQRGVPKGDFDLAHLRAIHRHPFQDINDWAGEIRKVEISKGGHQFMFRQFIHNGMADVRRRVVDAKFFRGTTKPAFAEAAAAVIGDVNYVHPFREGNGRTQVRYPRQLADAAGHRFDPRRIERQAWMEASIRAHTGDYAALARAIAAALA